MWCLENTKWGAKTQELVLIRVFVGLKNSWGFACKGPWNFVSKDKTVEHDGERAEIKPRL